MKRNAPYAMTIAFVWELRVLIEYLALDAERRSLYRDAVRDRTGAE